MKQNLAIKKINVAIKHIILLLFTACTFHTSAIAQERKLTYDVMRNGNIIGTINFVELIQGQKKFLSFTADVKTRFIFSYCNYSSETAAYDNGVMIYSSFYQKQNGSEKGNKLTIASGKEYKLVDNGNTKLVSFSPIRYNMLLLYTNMPETIDKVYSDNYQKMLDIKKVEPNKYRLLLPDGNYNYYTYQNGVCSKVEVERTLFTLQFILTKDSLKN